MELVSNEARAKNQLASDWMHRGMDLAKENSNVALEKAIRCFDEAIALRSSLPLADHPFFRYGLSAGWINRGDACARLGGDQWVDALKSYDEALKFLKSLPLEENALYPRRLAITWINRGAALEKQGLPQNKGEAAKCFREAITVLEHSSAQAVVDQQSLLAGAWTNLAGALMGSAEDCAEEIRASARESLALVKLLERTDVVSAEIGLKARHVLCRLAVKEILGKKSLSKIVVAESTDAVDEGMSLSMHWKSQAPAGFALLTRDIFRFGCRIYENSQPHFLAEYLMEYLGPETGDNVMLADDETLAAAQAAIWGALSKLQFDGFQFVATPQIESLLSDIQELRKVEDQLEQLRRARA